MDSDGYAWQERAEEAEAEAEALREALREMRDEAMMIRAGDKFSQDEKDYAARILYLMPAALSEGSKDG